MNLGSIKDRSGKMLLKKKTVKKAVGAACVCAVAVIAVTAVIAGRDTGEIPTVEAPVETQRVAAQVQTNSPKPQSTPAPTENTDQPVSSGVTVQEKMLFPLTKCTVIKNYADDGLVYSNTLKHWSTHNGMDLQAEEGSHVFSVLDGTVKSITEDSLMGITVTVSHEDGVETVYSSLKEVNSDVQVGTRVLRGQSIGTVGSSAASEASDGAHLHFEVKKNGKNVDPQSYLSDSVK